MAQPVDELVGTDHERRIDDADRRRPAFDFAADGDGGLVADRRIDGMERGEHPRHRAGSGVDQGGGQVAGAVEDRFRRVAGEE